MIRASFLDVLLSNTFRAILSSIVVIGNNFARSIFFEFFKNGQSFFNIFILKSEITESYLVKL